MKKNKVWILENTKSCPRQQVRVKRNKNKFKQLVPAKFVHGEPTVEFTMEEVNTLTMEKGLHQAVILKFSYGKPDLQELRQLLPVQLDVKGRCNIGQLEFFHILVRFDLYEYFVMVLSRSASYIKAKGEEYFHGR